MQVPSKYFTTTTAFAITLLGGIVLASVWQRKPKQKIGRFTLHDSSPASDTLRAELETRGVAVAGISEEGQEKEICMGVVKVPSGMSDSTCASYTALHYYRFADLPDDADLALLVPTHPEVDRKGHPYLNTLATMRVPDLTRRIIGRMAAQIRQLNPTVLIAFETRAMAFGAVLAYHCGCAFVPARKQSDTVGLDIIEDTIYDSNSYRDTSSIAIDGDPLVCGDRVVIVDDVVSSGATLWTLTKLIRSCRGVDVVGEISIVNFQCPERGILQIKPATGVGSCTSAAAPSLTAD